MQTRNIHIKVSVEEALLILIVIAATRVQHYANVGDWPDGAVKMQDLVTGDITDLPAELRESAKINVKDDFEVAMDGAIKQTRRAMNKRRKAAAKLKLFDETGMASLGGQSDVG